VAPTMEVEDESSVEVLEAKASVQKDTRAEPVYESMEERISAEPVHMDVEEIRIGVEPVLEAEEMRIREELVPADVEMGTGDMPVHEKVGQFTPEKTPQTPAEPVSEIPAEETPSSDEPRRKRFKTLVGRTDLPWVRKLIA